MVAMMTATMMSYLPPHWEAAVVVVEAAAVTNLAM